MGSVKDLKVIEKPSGPESGIGHFVFSDRYSVFDWGSMPEGIKDKGRALCITGSWFFEKLSSAGIKTHYRGLVEGGQSCGLQDISTPVNEMEVNLFRVIKPVKQGGSYDYSSYKKEKGNFLIPLEVIYRNTLPAGSSVFRRLEEGSITPSDLGLSEEPRPGQVFTRPLFDVSTKLEPSDRYINWQEAAEIAFLRDEEVEELKEILARVNDIISESVAPMELKNCDGKIELAYDGQRSPVVVDVIGTPDECRFTYRGIPVSKEIARNYYRNTSWYREIKEAKSNFGPDWKKEVKDPPPPLPAGFSKILSGIYLAFTNGLTGKEWFKVPPLKELLDEAGEYIK